MEILKINSHWLDFLFTQRCKIALINALFFIIFAAFSHAAETSAPEGITVDLRHPEFSEGILRTDHGGVITADTIRIQGRKILYIKKVEGDQTTCKIEAEEDILIEYGDYLFVGRRLEYDFQTKTGIIYEGKTALEPWFFGGEQINLHADGSFTIYNSFLTTSENSEMEWKLSADKTIIYPNHNLHSYNFKFNYYDFPLMWIPHLKVNLNYILDFPINYSARWGGRQGPRVEFLYEVFSWGRWKTFLKFDYRLTRGPGFGFESYYRSEDRKETFESINYIARDSSLNNPNERFRYRFQGIYANSFFDDKVTLSLTYDKLSDKDMATDYSDSGLSLEYPGATALLVRRQSDNWIANFKTTARLNNFQTMKQELPAMEISWKPFNIANTNIVSNQLLRISYLNFLYAKHIHGCHDYDSSRIQYIQQFYRSFRTGALIWTPEIGGTAIYYGNLPEKNDRWLLMGIFRVDAKAPFYKEYPLFNHTLTPYARYEFSTLPTSTPKEHYIFDIDDGLYELQLLRFGFQQTFYLKTQQNILYRPLKLDIFANAFLNSKTYTSLIPKVYGYVNYYSTPWLKHTLDAAWDFEHGMLDHINIRTACTFGPNAALAAEYRHRDEYDFRKADHTNYMIDAYKSPKRLEHSTMSDRRDTLLFNLFYRFHPLWALELQSRHGWNRKIQPNYTEFEIDLVGKPHAAWQVKFSYQHCENDKHRFTVYFNMGTLQPERWKCEHITPFAEF